MEPVNELDIDGYRWEIKDVQARQDIANLKSLSEITYKKRIPLTLKPGVTAEIADIVNFFKVGKLCFGDLNIKNLDGESFLNKANTDIAEMPFKPLGDIEFITLNTPTKEPFRTRILRDRGLNIITDMKFNVGYNFIIGTFICLEQ